jgi:acetylornithine aminotransferase
LSATGSRKVQAGFEPLVGGFIRAPFGDADAVARIAERSRDIAALLVEPIQGEAGVQVPPDGYLARLRQICDRHGWLLIVDEIQSGLCRSGRWFAHQHEEIQPDVITSAKALANGLPIGACLARGDAARAFKPGQHGSTFGGNLLVCRAALTALEIMERDHIAKHAAAMGEYIRDHFRQRIGHLDCVRDIRGRGLMIGVELDRDVNAFRQAALDKGLLLNVTQDRVIRLLPPLIIDQAQAGQIVDTVSGLVEGLD